MRKIVAISLIAILIAPFWIAFSTLQLEKNAARKKAKWTILRGLEDDELISFNFSLEESRTLLDWKHDHEFQYKGVMYDIVRKTESADSVFYYCWADHNETLVENRIENLLNQHNNNRRNNFSKLLTNILTGLYPPVYTTIQHPQAAKTAYPVAVFHFRNFTIKPLIPPPKFPINSI